MSKTVFLTVVIAFLIGTSGSLSAAPLVGSDSYFDSEGRLSAPIQGFDKLANGKIHQLIWKNRICYLSVTKSEWSGGCRYRLSLSREKSPNPEDFSGDYRKHILQTVSKRREFKQLDKSKVVIYTTTAFQRISLIFDFDPETNTLIKVVGKCGYRPFMPTVMTGCPVEGKDASQNQKKAAFKDLYKD